MRRKPKAIGAFLYAMAGGFVCRLWCWWGILSFRYASFQNDSVECFASFQNDSVGGYTVSKTTVRVRVASVTLERKR